MAKWYGEHPWLEYSIKIDNCYWYFCQHFGALTSSSTKKPQTDALLHKGFQNWRKGLDNSKSLDKHLQSQGHLLAAHSFAAYQERKRT